MARSQEWGNDMRYSAVLILPAAFRDDGNQLAAVLGHDEANPPDTYNVPLFKIGDDGEPTHFGTHAWVTEAFRATIEDGQNGKFPAGLEGAEPVVGALVASFAPLDETDASAHFDSVASAHALERRTTEVL